jgi:hypothetical protein
MPVPGKLWYARGPMDREPLRALDKGDLIDLARTLAHLSRLQAAGLAGAGDRTPAC